MTWHNKVKGFTVPVYGGQLFLCHSTLEWDKCIKHLGLEQDPIPSSAGRCGQYAQIGGGALHLIGVFDDRDDTLVHELAHASFNILGRAGVPVVDDAANEAYAYLIDTLFREVKLITNK